MLFRMLRHPQLLQLFSGPFLTLPFVGVAVQVRLLILGYIADVFI